MPEKAFLHGDQVIYFHSYGLNPPDHKVGWFLRSVNDGHGYNRIVVAEDPERLAKGYGVDVHPKYTTTAPTSGTPASAGPVGLRNWTPCARS